METIAQHPSRASHEQRLVGRQRCQIADPGPSDAQTEQDERHNAAGGSRERAENAANATRRCRPAAFRSVAPADDAVGAIPVVKSRQALTSCLFPCRKFKRAVASSL